MEPTLNLPSRLRGSYTHVIIVEITNYPKIELWFFRSREDAVEYMIVNKWPSSLIIYRIREI